ncbi:MAG: GTP cyclohydrolase II [Dongiaceae bacterium]
MLEPLTAEPAEPSADADLLAGVDRATAELRRGGLVVVHDGAGAAALVQAAETVADGSLARLRALTGDRLLLALTARRAAALGLAAGGAGVVALTLSEATVAGAVRRLADPTVETATRRPDGLKEAPLPADFAEAGVELAKLACLLPAAVLAALGGPGPGCAGGFAEASAAAYPPAWAVARGLPCVLARQVFAYRTAAARTLRPVGEARVPLAGAGNARIVAFRPSDGGVEHVAIVIGEPSPTAPVLTRLHSACFTGDLLGSLRCDCGDQLRGAIDQISREGNGLLLYLAQEGRGIGLVNKLRAYRLQDLGADTVDANEQLGFDADERLYQAAAEMLRRLGFSRVRLMTNNPEKVAGLARCGVTVTARVPHVIPANGHNDRYLETKAARFGHLL